MSSDDLPSMNESEIRVVAAAKSMGLKRELEDHFPNHEPRLPTMVTVMPAANGVVVHLDVSLKAAAGDEMAWETPYPDRQWVQYRTGSFLLSHDICALPQSELIPHVRAGFDAALPTMRLTGLYEAKDVA